MNTKDREHQLPLPISEHWLLNNPEAKASVEHGLAQAKNGELKAFKKINQKLVL